MLVRIVKDWTFPDIFRQTPGGTRYWEGIEFTDKNVLNCDLIVVLNAPNQHLIVSTARGGKWLFSQESPIDYYRWHTKSFKYFDKVFSFWDEKISKNIIHAQTALPWHIGKTFDELLVLSPKIEEKTDKISWVTSNASEKPGHKLRMAFKDFLKDRAFKFDLYGRGFTPIANKFDAIYPYKYSIAIENYSCDDYWTEKIADCFLSWTIPIYYGAKNITKYFPEKAMILIDPNNPEKALDVINDAISNDIYIERIPYLQEARELILHKYQFFPYITDLIKNYAICTSHREWSYIPKNADPQYSFVSCLKRKISFFKNENINCI